MAVHTVLADSSLLAEFAVVAPRGHVAECTHLALGAALAERPSRLNTTQTGNAADARGPPHAAGGPHFADDFPASNADRQTVRRGA